MRYFKKNKVDTPEVNLTPLIDVTFLILIVFIVLAPLIELDNIKVYGSSQNKQTSVDKLHEQAIIIRADASNQITLNHNKIDLASLPNQLADYKIKFPSYPIRLIQDTRSTFGLFQSIKDAATAAGYEALDIVTLPDEA